jgi:hypothetical protein
VADAGALHRARHWSVARLDSLVCLVLLLAEKQTKRGFVAKGDYLSPLLSFTQLE